MTLRIKNWSKHQHFKDRTPPWIKLYRDILDDPDWHDLDGDTAKVLVSLWLIASEDENHKGQLPDLRKLAFRLRIKESQLTQEINKLFHWLIRDDIDAISERYQSDAPETETETETETKEALSDSQANTDVVVLKNGKQKFKGDAEIVLAFLNEKTGRAYRPLTANLDFIAERLKEGATVADCRKVIAKKSREWTGTDMAQYLRPATLFNRTKFAQYVGELHVEQSPIGDYV